MVKKKKKKNTDRAQFDILTEFSFRADNNYFIHARGSDYLKLIENVYTTFVFLWFVSPESIKRLCSTSSSSHFTTFKD